MIDLSPETELLARRVAAAQHRTVEDAVREALEIRARTVGVTLRHPRDASAQAVAERREHAARYVTELAAMPVLDKCPLREIVDDLQARMIVVDSSALLAISFREPKHQAFLDVITDGERCVMSAVNAHETATVLRARPGVGTGLFNSLN